MLGTTQVALRAKNPDYVVGKLFLPMDEVVRTSAWKGFLYSHGNFHCFHGSFLLLLWKIPRASSKKINVYETSLEEKWCALPCMALFLLTVRKVKHRVHRSQRRTVVNNSFGVLVCTVHAAPAISRSSIPQTWCLTPTSPSGRWSGVLEEGRSDGQDCPVL